MEWNEVASKLHVYMERKEGETEEEAKKRMETLLYRLQDEEGVEIYVHELYTQQV